MFIVHYTVNLYICVFMTFSTSCCLHDTLMDPWNVCSYVCTQWELWSIFVLGVEGVNNSVIFLSTHGRRPHKLQCWVEIPSGLWMFWCLCLTFSSKSVVICGVRCNCCISRAILLCVVSPYHYKFCGLLFKRKEAFGNLDSCNWLWWARLHTLYSWTVQTSTCIY